MFKLLNSLSYTQAWAVVLGLSIAMAFGWARIRGSAFRWSATVAAPLIVAYSLYWAPIWILGVHDRSSFAPLASVFIVPWSVAGILCSILTVVCIRKVLQRQRRAPQSNG